MAANLKYCIIEQRGHLLIVKFNYPEKKNAWNAHFKKEIINILKKATEDDSITIVALTGVGDFYSSGNEMSMPAISPEEDYIKTSIEVVRELVRAFFTFPKILIAVVNGPCIGIAATTAALCDIVYSAENAYFLTPFTRLGLCAEGCSSYTFPKILGQSKSAEMLLLNHKMSAKEAYEFKFTAKVLTRKEIEHDIWIKLEEMANLSLNTLMVGKKLLKKFDLDNLEKANNNELEQLYPCMTSDETINAVLNFINRRNSKI